MVVAERHQQLDSDRVNPFVFKILVFKFFDMKILQARLLATLMFSMF